LHLGIHHATTGRQVCVLSSLVYPLYVLVLIPLETLKYALILHVLVLHLHGANLLRPHSHLLCHIWLLLLLLLHHHIMHLLHLAIRVVVGIIEQSLLLHLVLIVTFVLVVAGCCSLSLVITSLNTIFRKSLMVLIATIRLVRVLIMPPLLLLLLLLLLHVVWVEVVVVVRCDRRVCGESVVILMMRKSMLLQLLHCLTAIQTLWP